MEEIKEADFEEMPVSGTILYWILKNGHKSMWRLAWSIWWRIIVMGLATSLIFRTFMNIW